MIGLDTPSPEVQQLYNLLGRWVADCATGTIIRVTQVIRTADAAWVTGHTILGENFAIRGQLINLASPEQLVLTANFRKATP
jgi:hypothetical protein